MGEVILKVTIPAIQAAFHVLSNAEVTGRTEARAHERAFRALKLQCTEDVKGADGAVTNSCLPGEWTMPETSYEYFTELLERALRKSMPGVLTIGLGDLFDAMEAKTAKTAIQN